MTADDWREVRAIYDEGIAGQNATFETDSPEFQTWNAAHHSSPRLVAVDGARVVGFAALAPVSARAVYRGVAEVSIYVASAHQGQGTGKLLLQRLIDQAEQAGFWTLQSSVFEENVATISLHRSCGFRLVGRREKLGQQHGRWRDVLLFERRSPETD